MSLSIPAEVRTALVARNPFQYREFQRVVEIQDFVAVSRRPGKNRA